MISREASSVSVIEKTLIASYIAYSKIVLIRTLEAWPMMLIGELVPTNKRSKGVDSALLSSVRSLCKK